jgi:hypothetical protein
LDAIPHLRDANAPSKVIFGMEQQSCNGLFVPDFGNVAQQAPGAEQIGKAGLSLVLTSC